MWLYYGDSIGGIADIVVLTSCEADISIRVDGKAASRTVYSSGPRQAGTGQARASGMGTAPVDWEQLDLHDTAASRRIVGAARVYPPMTYRVNP